jgi:ribonucleoside-diphosphate reductase alpha chain
VGPFAGYAKNRESMLRVIGKHRDAVNHVDHSLVPESVMTAAHQVWDEAYMLGQKHGYRNAQTTVLAPTGTIAFMMDCDTTGIEPDIALVKYKKLVGGGLLKIVNQTVPEALGKLGYTDEQVAGIVEYIDKNDTIEGAPMLKDEHLPVFDCAFKPMNGTRSIQHMGHIKMMAAAQPFLSGAISKTVNMPEACTVEDIMDAYIQSWKLGVKAVAIYRDNSKRTQPLSTTTDAAKADAKALAAEPKRAVRRKLPDERQSVTHKFSIAGQEGYFIVGLYEDGSPGELFIKMSKEGSTISGLMDSFAVSISLCLQYGVPLRVLVTKFSHTRFEPSGFTTNREIPMAKSLMDYIFRWFDLKFHPNGDNGHFGKQAEPEVHEEEPNLLTVANPAPAPEKKAQPSLNLTFPAPPAPLKTNGANGHKNGNGHAKLSAGDAERTVAVMQTDAPPCSTCGTLMVRSGACYRCPDCGTTSGCG